AGVRAHLDRRRGRPGEDDRHRAEHGHPLRDGPGTRAGELRQREGHSTPPDIARSMAPRYAMVPGLGPVSYDNERDTLLGPQGLSRRTFSEETAREIDLAVREILQNASERRRTLLGQRP